MRLRPQVAKWLGAPVLLVLDCWALSRSAAAMVHGYRTFDPHVDVAGVIMNRVAGAAHAITSLAAAANNATLVLLATGFLAFATANASGGATYDRG